MSKVFIGMLFLRHFSGLSYQDLLNRHALTLAQLDPEQNPGEILASLCDCYMYLFPFLRKKYLLVSSNFSLLLGLLFLNECLLLTACLQDLQVHLFVICDFMLCGISLCMSLLFVKETVFSYE